jgi:membrane protease YdiL (CAAX protease family)
MNFIRSIKGVFWNKEENRLRMFWRLMVYSTLLSLVIVLLSVVFGITNVLSNTFCLSFVILLGVVVTTIMVGKWVDRRSIKDFGLIPSTVWWKEFFFGLGLGALLMGLVFIISWVTGSLTVEGYFQGSHQGAFLPEFLKAVGFYFAVGVYEEVMLRGYILVNLAEGLKIKNVDKKWVLLLALLLSSMIFGVLHITNPNSSLVSTLNLSVAGVFLGLGMVLTGRLGLPIGLHITWNLFQGNVFGFPVSGTNSGATIISTTLTGPEWFTGGEFGPEAGILGLLAMVVGCLMILLWISRRSKLALKKEIANYQQSTSITES